MRLEAEVDDRDFQVQVERKDGSLAVLLNGRPLAVDARVLEKFFTSIIIDRKAYEVTVEPEDEAWRVQIGIDVHRVRFLDPLRPTRGPESASGGSGRGRRPRGPIAAISMMPGKVARVLVKQGDEVAEGQGLVVVEAMKMENVVAASGPGRVLEVKVTAGEAVEAGATLLIIG